MALMETFMGRFTGDLYFIFTELREKTLVITVKKQKRFRSSSLHYDAPDLPETIFHRFRISKTLIEYKLKERFYCN